MNRRLTTGPQYRAMPRLHRFHPYSRTLDSQLDAFMQEDVRHWQPLAPPELRDMNYEPWDSLVDLQESNHLLYHSESSSRRASCLQRHTEDASMQALVPSPTADILAEFMINDMGGTTTSSTSIGPMQVTVSQSSGLGAYTGHGGLPVRSGGTNGHTDLYGGQAEGEGWNRIYDARSSLSLEGCQPAEAYDTSLNWQMNLQHTETTGQTGCIPANLYEAAYTPSERELHRQPPPSFSPHCWLPMACAHASNDSLQAYRHEPSNDRHHGMVQSVTAGGSYKPTTCRSPPETEPSLDSLLSDSSSPSIEPLWPPDMPIKSQDRNGLSIPGALWQATLKCYWRGCRTILSRSSCATYENFLKQVFTHLAEHVGESDLLFRCQWKGCKHKPKETTKPITERDRIQHVLTHLKRWYHLCTDCGKLYRRKYTGEQKHSCRKNPNIPEHCGEMTLAYFWDCYGYPVENVV